MAWGSISLFAGFLEKENFLETLIMIFENVSPKGFFWLNMKDFEISVLTANSRYLQKGALKPLKEKITNPIRSKTGLDPVGMVLDKTESRIGRDHDAMSITLSPPFSIKILWRSGNATATKRSILIETKWKNEVWHERLTKTWYTSSSALVLHLWKKFKWLMNSRTIGSHIKVTIRSAIAKLNRR